MIFCRRMFVIKLGRGTLKVTFDEPEESHLNWRQHSWVSDVWLLKK